MVSLTHGPRSSSCFSFLLSPIHGLPAAPHARLRRTSTPAAQFSLLSSQAPTPSLSCSSPASMVVLSTTTSTDPVNPSLRSSARLQPVRPAAGPGGAAWPRSSRRSAATSPARSRRGRPQARAMEAPDGEDQAHSNATQA